MGGRAGGQARAGRRPHRVRQDARRRSCGRSTGWRRARRPRRRSTGAASSTSRRSRRWRSTSSATCARRSRASGRPHSGWGSRCPTSRSACAPATPRPTSGASSPAPRPMCWSPRPSRCSCCSPRLRGSRCAGVTTVILDEVHAVAGTKRGAHLALSLERLDELLERPAQRIGLSATVRPLDEVSTFLAGARPVEVVQPRTPKTVAGVGRGAGARSRRARRATRAGQLRRGGGRLGGGHRPAAVDLARGRAQAPGAGARTPVHDRVRQLPAARRAAHVAAQRAGRRGGGGRRRSSTSSRPRRSGSPGIGGGAAATVAKAHHGSMSREQRTLVEEELKGGRAALRRGHVQPGAGHRHGRGRSRHPGRGAAERRLGAAAGRPRGPPGRRGVHRRGVPEVPRRSRRVRGGRRADDGRCDRVAALPAQPARRARPAHRRDGRAGAVDARRARRASCAGRRRSPRCPSRRCTPCSTCWPGATRREEFGELRARITWDRVTDQLARPPRCAAAGRHLRRHDPRSRAVHRDDARRGRRRGLARRRAGRGDGLRVAGRRHDPARARRAGGSRTSPTTA